jgi:hypothetical protein
MLEEVHLTRLVESLDADEGESAGSNRHWK